MNIFEKVGLLIAQGVGMVAGLVVIAVLMSVLSEVVRRWFEGWRIDRMTPQERVDYFTQPPKRGWPD